MAERTHCRKKLGAPKRNYRITSCCLLGAGISRPLRAAAGLAPLAHCRWPARPPGDGSRRAQPLPTRAPAAVSFGAEHPPPSSLARTLSAGRRTQRARLRSIPAHAAAGRNAPATAPTRGHGASPLRTAAALVGLHAAAALAGQRTAAASPACAPPLPSPASAPQLPLALAALCASRGSCSRTKKLDRWGGRVTGY